MIYQDRLERNLLQLFANTENSEWFSMISVISLEVNIFTEHENAKGKTIMGARLHWTQANSLNSWYVKTMGVRRGVKTGIWPSLEIGTKNKIFYKTWRQQLNSD